MKTSSVASSGCTTETRPLCRASAWNTNAPARATPPNSHNGLRNKYRTSRQPEDRRGGAVPAALKLHPDTRLSSGSAAQLIAGLALDLSGYLSGQPLQVGAASGRA